MEPSQLYGAWELLEWRIDYSDARAASHPFGTDATGLLLYTPDGWMSAGISRRERASLGGGSVRHADAGQRAEAFDGHFHYHGHWHTEGETVVHTVSGSLNPDFVGSRQVRLAHLVGEELELSAEDRLPGSEVRRRHLLRWRRAHAP